MKGVKHTLVVQHNAKTETIDINLNKASEQKTDVPFNDFGHVFPVTLSDDLSGIKATVNFDENAGSNGLYTFDINGEPWD